VSIGTADHALPIDNAGEYVVDATTKKVTKANLLATTAPLVHTRTASAVTDFATAVSSNTAVAAATAHACVGYFTHPCAFGLVGRSRDMAMVVVETAQDRESGHASRTRTLPLRSRCSRRDGPTDPLVRSVVVAVRDIRAEDASPVGLAREQEEVRTLPPHAAQEPLARRIGARRADGRAEDPNPARGGEAVAVRPIRGMALST
jgi:hypothetical protein